MPEGPEIRIIAEALNDRLQGATLYSITLGPKSKIIQGVDNLTLPLRIYGVTCMGKKIVFIFIVGCRYEFMMSSLGITGSWNWNPLNNTHLTLSGTLGNGEPFNACYDDPLKYGNISLFSSLDHLQENLRVNQGPDLLENAMSLYSGGQPSLTIEQYRAAYTSRRANKQICWLLLEQKIFSGIGNYLKAEILYEAGIKPTRVISSLSIVDIDNLYYLSLKIIYDAYSHNGLTIQSYWDPNGVKGTYPVKVYSKSICPLGHLVEKGTFQDKRTTHFCSTCQH